MTIGDDNRPRFDGRVLTNLRYNANGDAFVLRGGEFSPLPACDLIEVFRAGGGE